ncbi:hypothetical protein ABK040_014321 [Willaertia magna]
MSQQRKFIDETSKVERKQLETVLLKRELKKNQKKARVRKVLRNKGLLQNYFEFYSSDKTKACSKACNQKVIQYEVKNLSDGHAFISCTLVNNCQTNNNEKEKVNSSSLTTCNSINSKDLMSSSMLMENNKQLVNTTLQLADIEKCAQNYRGVVLVSEHFHLQLDVEDFINSYNALLDNKTFLSNNLKL